MISIVAGIGGVLVFLGLWMEGKPNEKPLRNIDEYRKHKARAVRGWCILMVGIFVEIVVAVAFAAKDGWEIKRIKDNAAQNALENRPIADAYVDLQFTVQETNTVQFKSVMGVAYLYFCRFPNDGSINFPAFHAFDYRFVDYPRGTRTYYLRLHPAHGIGVGSADQANWGFGFPASEIEKLDAVKLVLDFLPRHSEILEGMAVLVGNPGIRKKFPIPRMKLFFTEGYIHIVNGTNAVPISGTMDGTNYIPPRISN